MQEGRSGEESWSRSGIGGTEQRCSDNLLELKAAYAEMDKRQGGLFIGRA
jgi:hypothetical protein